MTSIGNAERLPERDGPSEQEIVERIYEAVMEQRLAPRTKLSESMLCKAFDVGRMRVRRALLLLASQGIVDLHSNRGAFVASPDAKEARDVFDARMMLEPSVVRQLASDARSADLEALARHIEREEEARRGGERREAIRLSGEFHVRLAAATGNDVVTRMLRELVTRTSVIIGLFGSMGTSNCPEHEHADILDAVRSRDGDRAEVLIRTHLELIEADLDLSATGSNSTDLATMLGAR